MQVEFKENFLWLDVDGLGPSNFQTVLGDKDLPMGCSQTNACKGASFSSPAVAQQQVKWGNDYVTVGKLLDSFMTGYNTERQEKLHKKLGAELEISEESQYLMPKITVSEVVQGNTTDSVLRFSFSGSNSSFDQELNKWYQCIAARSKYQQQRAQIGVGVRPTFKLSVHIPEYTLTPLPTAALGEFVLVPERALGLDTLLRATRRVLLQRPIYPRCPLAAAREHIRNAVLFVIAAWYDELKMSNTNLQPENWLLKDSPVFASFEEVLPNGVWRDNDPPPPSDLLRVTDTRYIVDKATGYFLDLDHFSAAAELPSDGASESAASAPSECEVSGFLYNVDPVYCPALTTEKVGTIHKCLGELQFRVANVNSSSSISSQTVMISKHYS
jgi:hypothetical protein